MLHARIVAPVRGGHSPAKLCAVRSSGWTRVSASVLLAVVIAVGGGLGIASLVTQVVWRHAGSHLAFGLAALILLISAVYLWPRPEGRQKWARGVLTAGVVALTAGQVFEAVGAFGYAADDGNLVVNPTVANLHTIGILFFPIGMLLVLGGALSVLGVGLWARRHTPRSRVTG